MAKLTTLLSALFVFTCFTSFSTFANSTIHPQSTERIVLNLQFDTASAVIRPGFEEELQTIADRIKGLNAPSIKLEGFTDSQDKQENNIPLSEHRAYEVAKVLADYAQLDIHQFRWIGIGELNPIANNNTAEGRSRNRRVELVISLPSDE
ncbi:OmpA family protein [Shewanella gelidii]|uniref:OmpA-like domain-containing protein n=1 Tax=Shewanella gelidii TaxID=1642821 RepID=A0A917JYE4_9GAMM|nr:OmpA family protein [Shewanella gelidii]MCL1099607.1 OmpA family protein [Shewanella gelidii]GGI92708.1 hypothetical protein GCM10009332_32490 [Shewanella gelidii]